MLAGPDTSARRGSSAHLSGDDKVDKVSDEQVGIPESYTVVMWMGWFWQDQAGCYPDPRKTKKTAQEDVGSPDIVSCGKETKSSRLPA